MNSRRELLGRMAYAIGVLPYLAFAPRSLLGTLLFDPPGALVPAKPLPINPFMRGGKALVAMVHGHELSTMLQEGLRLLGGDERLQLTGKRVLLKPNVVNDRPPPSITNPILVGAVTQLVRARGASEVIVADSSGMLRFPTAENLSVTGVRAAAEAAGARVLALEDEPWLRVEPSQAKAVPTYYVSKPVYDADVFINLPVIKTHKFAHYSCSLKNLVGIVHPRYRPSLSVLSGHWHERIAELNLAVHPHLTIADGHTMMIAGGPTTGTAVRADLLLLSGDRIALDAVAVALIRSYGVWKKVSEHGIWAQRQIRRAMTLGLGISSPQAMELVALSVSGKAPEFERRVETVKKDLERV